jgi:hypothetical protein
MAQSQRSRGEDVGWRRRITLAGQDVEHDIGGMNAVGDRLGAGCLDGRQTADQIGPAAFVGQCNLDLDVRVRAAGRCAESADVRALLMEEVTLSPFDPSIRPNAKRLPPLSTTAMHMGCPI